MQKKIMIKSFVTIVIVATIVAGHQQKFSDDDVVVKTRQNNEVQTTFEQLKKVCEDVKQKDKIDYVGGSKYVYGADRCMKGEHGTRWTGTCYWAVVTEPKNRETELLKSCGKDNKLRTSGLSKGTSPGAVYLIVKQCLQDQEILRSRPRRIWRVKKYNLEEDLVLTGNGFT